MVSSSLWSMSDFWIPAALLSLFSGLAYHYSTREQWGIIHKDYFGKAKFFVGMLLGLIPAFYLRFLNWYAVIGGGILLAIVASLLYCEDRGIFKSALTLGLFLMCFDWLVENLGAVMGFWFSYKAALFVGKVPIEVMVAATTGGYAFVLLIPRTWNTKYVLLSSIICAIGGTFGEDTLQHSVPQLMRYSGGWSWPHALTAYFLTWVILELVWYRIFLNPVKTRTSQTRLQSVQRNSGIV